MLLSHKAIREILHDTLFGKKKIIIYEWCVSDTHRVLLNGRTPFLSLELRVGIRAEALVEIITSIFANLCVLGRENNFARKLLALAV